MKVRKRKQVRLFRLCLAEISAEVSAVTPNLHICEDMTFLLYRRITFF